MLSTAPAMLMLSEYRARTLSAVHVRLSVYSLKIEIAGSHPMIHSALREFTLSCFIRMDRLDAIYSTEMPLKT